MFEVAIIILGIIALVFLWINNSNLVDINSNLVDIGNELLQLHKTIKDKK